MFFGWLMVCLLIFSFRRCEEVAACSRTRRGGGRGMAPFKGSRGSFSVLIVVGNCDFDVDPASPKCDLGSFIVIINQFNFQRSGTLASLLRRPPLVPLGDPSPLKGSHQVFSGDLFSLCEMARLQL